MQAGLHGLLNTEDSCFVNFPVVMNSTLLSELYSKKATLYMYATFSALLV